MQAWMRELQNGEYALSIVNLNIYGQPNQYILNFNTVLIDIPEHVLVIVSNFYIRVLIFPASVSYVGTLGNSL